VEEKHVEDEIKSLDNITMEDVEMDKISNSMLGTTKPIIVICLNQGAYSFAKIAKKMERREPFLCYLQFDSIEPSYDIIEMLEGYEQEDKIPAMFTLLGNESDQTLPELMNSHEKAILELLRDEEASIACFCHINDRKRLENIVSAVLDERTICALLDSKRLTYIQSF